MLKILLIFASNLRKLAAKIIMEEEIWREINGYEGCFEVSNLGNFRSKDRIVGGKKPGSKRNYPGKSLKTESTLEGYTRIVLMKNHIRKRYMCHKLVAEMFVPNPENKPFVNHLNGIKWDNRASNLEWVTQSENELHSHRVLGNTMKGKTNPVSVSCVTTNKVFPSMSEAVRFLHSLGYSACIEGIKKAIKADRLYHNYKFTF